MELLTWTSEVFFLIFIISKYFDQTLVYFVELFRFFSVANFTPLSGWILNTRPYTERQLSLFPSPESTKVKQKWRFASQWLLQAYGFWFHRDRFSQRKIHFTDESLFTRDGIFNSRNTHEWIEETSHSVHRTSNQRRFHLNVYILPARLSGNNYLIFLQEVLSDLLVVIPLEETYPRR